MQHHPLLDDYDAIADDLRAESERLSQQVTQWLTAEPGLKVHSVTLRVKSRASLGQKLVRPDRSYASLWDITDLIGLRVITYFDDAVDSVGKLIEARLPVAYEHSIDKRRRRDASAFGYRSLHYVCKMHGGHGANLTIPSGACFEIQVRTVLEHAWAEIEHDLGYKARDAVPPETRRRLNRLAGLLELADQEFGAIRRDLEHYARMLPDRIDAAADSVPLDRLSLSLLLEDDEVQVLDRAIAVALGKELGTQAFFPEYLLKMLAASGLKTVASAREGIRTHAESILSMVQPYFAFAFKAWSLSPDQMVQVFRGYSLFFLAHAEVLKASALGIDKVERLAHLYREIDYPDDAHAAQRVASMLVDAFGDAAVSASATR